MGFVNGLAPKNAGYLSPTYAPSINGRTKLLEAAWANEACCLAAINGMVVLVPNMQSSLCNSSEDQSRLGFIYTCQFFW